MKRTAVSWLSLCFLLVSLGVGGMSCDSSNKIGLGTPPDGYSFTDEDGNPVNGVEPGTVVQIRDEEGNVLVAFTVDSNADLSGLELGRTEDVSFAHFADTNSLTGDITLFVPCGPGVNTLYVTPGAQSAAEVSTDGGGAGTITLSIAAPGPTDGYTFVNAATRVGDEDCQVSADVSEFSTGAAGDTVDGNGFPPDTVGMTFSSTTFAETGANDGTVDSITVTVVNDTFAPSDTFTADTDYTLSGTTIPEGLTLSVEKTSATEATITLEGAATSHLDADDVTGIQVTFLDAAFTGGSRPDIGVGGVDAVLTIDFDDPTIVVFSAGEFNGYLEGRDGADLKCETAGLEIFSGRRNFTALLSVQIILQKVDVPDDSIANMPANFSVPTGQEVRSLTKDKLSDDWSGLLDGSIDISLESAGVVSEAANGWWSGSNSDGTLSGNDCDGWNYPVPDVVEKILIQGDFGLSDSTSTTWMKQASPGACDVARELLCVAYESEPI
jgi:hypothetical protein